MIFLAAIVFAFAPAGASAATTISVSATASHPIPTTLWGQMFEDIMLQNRAFQQVTPNTTAALNAWVPIGEAAINVIADPSPLSFALPNSLVLTISPNTTGDVGFANTGYWEDGATLAAYTTQLRSVDGWAEVTAILKPERTPSSTANRFAVTVSNTGNASAGWAGSTFCAPLAVPSDFQGTQKRNARGYRIRLKQLKTLADAGPAFFRFPGGNNLEGQTTATRWQWRNTVGPLSERPGRVGDWTYINTDGLGLLEYLLWCEDVDMEPFMAVWDGYSLGGTSVTGAALDPFIAEAIDQMPDQFRYRRSLRQVNQSRSESLSRAIPEPFKLRFVEIGNEDFVGQAPGTVATRWNSFVTNLTATFPQLQFMATSKSTGPVLTPTPEVYDAHVYQTPEMVLDKLVLVRFDAPQWNAVLRGRIRLHVDKLEQSAAVGEAAFMMGFERNADIVFLCFWTPNLVGFDAGNVFKSTSYYVQKLFGNNRGDEYLPSTLPDNTTSGTLFWSVTRWTSTNELILKISNNAAAPADPDLRFTIRNRFLSRFGPGDDWSCYDQQYA
ncbi:glycoside hydrolase family 51 protein [Mycena amicta]|nr:glycoside hydrolase family 51 protein [Mycena amicta]